MFLSADGHDLKEIPPEQLYDQAAFVLQDNNDLFDATMRRSRSPRMPRAVTASASVSPVCAPYLSHVHLHNNDGVRDLHAPLDQGAMDIAGLLTELSALCPRATVTLELGICR